MWELVRVGKGQRSAADFAAMVAAGSAARGEVGAAAPPQGLCLLRVLYGAGDDLLTAPSSAQPFRSGSSRCCLRFPIDAGELFSCCMQSTLVNFTPGRGAP